MAVGMDLLRKQAERAASFGLTYSNNHPLDQYCIYHSIDLQPIQMEMAKECSKHRFGFMCAPIAALQLCNNLIELIGARKVLDVGTFMGSSALNWALAIPEDGKVITMDITDEDYNKYGKKIVDKSGVSHKIDFRIQTAQKTLQELIDNGQSLSFDFAFIDANKEDYLEFYDLCYKLIRPGGIIVVDDALWFGTVFINDTDPCSKAIHEVNRKAKDDKNVHTMLLPNDGGLMIVFKKCVKQ